MLLFGGGKYGQVKKSFLEFCQCFGVCDNGKFLLGDGENVGRLKCYVMFFVNFVVKFQIIMYYQFINILCCSSNNNIYYFFLFI